MNTKIASLLIVILGAVSSHAAYKDLIGFPELENAIGAGTLTGAGIEVQIIEATPSGGSNYYPGNSGSDPEFSGKTITNVTDDAGVTLRIARLRSVLPLLRCRKPLGGLFPLLQATGIAAAVELPGKIRLRVAPAPGPLVQWLLGA